MSTTTPTATRPGCTAVRHDTSSAYRKARCRCPQATAAERQRRAAENTKQRVRNRCDATSMQGLTVAAAPPFHAHPDRGCADLADPDLMFDERHAEINKAKKLCNGCPFKQSCADWALEHRQVYGVWGGVSADTRRRAIARAAGRAGAR